LGREGRELQRLLGVGAENLEWLLAIHRRLTGQQPPPQATECIAVAGRSGLLSRCEEFGREEMGGLQSGREAGLHQARRGIVEVQRLRAQGIAIQHTLPLRSEADPVGSDASMRQAGRVQHGQAGSQLLHQFQRNFIPPSLTVKCGRQRRGLERFDGQLEGAVEHFRRKHALQMGGLQLGLAQSAWQAGGCVADFWRVQLRRRHPPHPDFLLRRAAGGHQPLAPQGIWDRFLDPPAAADERVTAAAHDLGLERCQDLGGHELLEHAQTIGLFSR
jgi:hypothetical protein